MAAIFRPKNFPDTFWVLMIFYFIVTILILCYCLRNFYCVRHHTVEPDCLIPPNAVIVQYDDREQCRATSKSNDGVRLAIALGDM